MFADNRAAVGAFLGAFEKIILKLTNYINGLCRGCGSSSGTKFTRENPRKSWKNFEFESTGDSYAHCDRAICDFTETLVAFRSGSIASRILAASGG